MRFFYIYLVVINIIAVIVTVDSVKESTLMLISALGGAPAMYLTMLTIHHKTRKPLFMIGIPVIFIIELILFFAVKHLWL